MMGFHFDPFPLPLNRSRSGQYPQCATPRPLAVAVGAWHPATLETSTGILAPFPVWLQYSTRPHVGPLHVRAGVPIGMSKNTGGRGFFRGTSPSSGELIAPSRSPA